MEKKNKKGKKLKIAVSVIVGITIICFVLYKVSFNVLAPVIFDFVVSRNPEAILKLAEDESADSLISEIFGDDDSEEKGENSDTAEKSDSENKSEEKADEKDGKDEKSGKNSDKAKDNKNGSKENTEDKKDEQKPKGYSTETYIGTLTSADMATVIKNISAADKTRIISICKSVVAASDMPRFAKMATSGMTGDDYSYAESYLRSHLSPAQKKEIMEIVRKYLGR